MALDAAGCCRRNELAVVADDAVVVAQSFVAQVNVFLRYRIAGDACQFVGCGMAVAVVERNEAQLGGRRKVPVAGIAQRFAAAHCCRGCCTVGCFGRRCCCCC